MAKTRSWFGWIKRLFICEAKAKSEKPRKLRWVFRRLKLRQKPVVAAVQESATLGEATEEQRKHALNVALATAAAAEAAVAAAKAAAEVVRLAGNAFMSQNYSKKPDVNLAAIKIQSAFRAYLARKALRALKALVRLQAIVRGRTVRRKVSASLKSLSSNVKLQLDAREEENVSTMDIIQKYKERKHWSKPRWEVKKELKLECSSKNSWDCSALRDEDIKTIWLRKQQGMIKRERMLRYSHSHRERTPPHMLLESIYTKEMGMRSCRLDHGGESKYVKPKNSAPTSCELRIPSQVKLKNLQMPDSIDGQGSPFSFPRRSFSCAEESLFEDDRWVLNSGVFPPYMTATESAKAKIRSLSAPRQRAGFMDSWFDNNKNAGKGVSLWSSLDGENTKIRNSQQLFSGNLNRRC